jgi:hypothetical protein
MQRLTPNPGRDGIGHKLSKTRHKHNYHANVKPIFAPGDLCVKTGPVLLRESCASSNDYTAKLSTLAISTNPPVRDTDPDLLKPIVSLANWQNEGFES